MDCDCSITENTTLMTTTTTTTTTSTTTTTITTTTSPFNNQYCNQPENSVPLSLKMKRVQVMRRGRNSMLLRVRVPKITQTDQYSGVFIWSKRDCGIDFIRKVNDGFVFFGVLDNEVNYEVVGKYQGQNERHANVAIQINANICSDKCLGTKS